MSARYYPAVYTTELYEAQNGLCAWCAGPIEQLGKGKAAVDHNHRCCNDRDKFGRQRVCGRCVRGLVHHMCNIRDIKSADWAFEHGLSFPETWMLEYVLRGEPDGTTGVRQPEWESTLKVETSPVIAEDIFSWPTYPSAEDIYLNMETAREFREKCPILSQKYLDGYSYVEIARQQHITVRTVQRWAATEKDTAKEEMELAA